MGDGPSQCEDQPVRDAPAHEHHASGQPDRLGAGSITGARGKIDRDEQHDTCGESERKEHGDHEVGWGGANSQETAQQEEDQDGDGEEGEGEEDVGAHGNGRDGDREHGLGDVADDEEESISISRCS